MGEEKELKIGEDLVTYPQLSRHLAASFMEEGEWAGVPVPVAGLDLVIEPRYKHKEIADFRWKHFYEPDGTRHEIPEEAPPEPSEYRRVNAWWNARYQLKVIVLQNQQGRAAGRFLLEDRLSYMLRSLEAASAWPLEAEEKAQKKLASLIPREMYELYMLTGHFPEESKRSKLTYYFRKGRPTLVVREVEEGWRPLCVLCLHPIGYYADTWAGVMCPTDEVIAHLLMMRGSEEKFWANANQHPIDRPSAGC